MTMTTVSADRFDQQTGEARQATRSGPVIITEDGRPTQVLLSIADYRRLKGEGSAVIDESAMPNLADIEFEAPRMKLSLRPADFD